MNISYYHITDNSTFILVHYKLSIHVMCGVHMYTCVYHAHTMYVCVRTCTCTIMNTSAYLFIFIYYIYINVPTYVLVHMYCIYILFIFMHTCTFFLEHVVICIVIYNCVHTYYHSPSFNQCLNFLPHGSTV